MSLFVKHRPILLLITLALVAAAVGSLEGGIYGFFASEDPFITLDESVPPGSMVKAIINSGETIDDFLFEGIPDGIGIAPGPTANTIDVYVNHEQSTVVFRDTADFQDSSVSKLTLDTTPGDNLGAVLAASVALSPNDGYIRFCSAFMAGPAEGFSGYTFITGEESSDIIDVPEGAPYGPDPALGELRQAGYAVILDTDTGESTAVPGLGRLNHENTVVVPGGWNQLALLTTDDTFSAPSAQLYLYLANHESHIAEDKGSLWAFRVTRTGDGPVDAEDAFNGANDYLDLQIGDDWQGEFIRVPKEIARGLTDEAPQDALENWSNENNVFQFIRLEDLAYDRHDNRVVYIADTGQTRIVPDQETGRMTRGPGGTAGLADNGRIFKMEFNAENPRKVDSFSIYADADAPGSNVYVPFVNPDNIETSLASLMVQEDADDARIWRHDFSSGSWEVVAMVNDTDWESSGITDASAWIGEGWWILTVQGHGLNVDEEFGDGGVLFKREAGQLLLMYIPGS